MIKRILKKIFSLKRSTLQDSLKQVKNLNFVPRVVIDIGAADGTFPLYKTFPESKHILIEPLEEFTPTLEQIVASLKDAEYFIAAAAARSGSITLHVHPDLVGSSLYLENEESNVNGVPREVPAVTLDELCQERELKGPYLIKIDVQGAELDVLAGAGQILRETDYIVLEVSLFGFFIDGPQFFDIIDYMKRSGFVVYDILSYQYRPLDNAMSQVDIVFVREDGLFRKHHHYATAEQRQSQNLWQRNKMKKIRRNS